MRITVLAGALAAGAFGVAASATADQGTAREYVVVYTAGASAADARAAIADAGGSIVSENTDIGFATVRSADADFAAHAAAEGALDGAASNRPIGKAPPDAQASPKRDAVERSGGFQRGPGRDRHGHVRGRGGHGHGGWNLTADPLADLQWDMQAIGATVDGSYRRQQGSHDVRVGIIDTGIDGTHPDIAPNFDAALSRNFTVDDPVIDGPCAEEPDQSCEDPANVDEDGHGTHVAGTVGAALNGIGIAGVAPKVDLVNLRAGQDSGYFFLGPTLDAITYAGDHGIDVVNMSFYTDPWLYNCTANPADSPAEQREQRLVISATQRAVDYARARGVTLIAAAGNEATDLGHPASDDTSPDYPPDAAHARTIDNSCISVPTETSGVIAVTATGRTGNKSYYSNYGLEQADVAAPGGDTRLNGVRNYPDAILAPFPLALAQASGLLNPDGSSNSPAIVRDCQGTTCAYYQYLQGTSMAAPHAVGVAALAVAQYGHRDWRNGGLTLDPGRVERLLLGTAVDTPCPTPNPFVYPAQTLEPPALCEGTPERNGFFGDGIVSATRIIAARY